MSIQWKMPPKIKVYEALGALVDGRFHLVSECKAEVVSSSGDKTYIVAYDPEKRAISSNDNASFWQGYLGYPAIAFLLQKHFIAYDLRVAESLKNIQWKDVNTHFKNNYFQTEAYVLNLVRERGGDVDEVKREVDNVLKHIEVLGLQRLANKLRPPKS